MVRVFEQNLALFLLLLVLHGEPFYSFQLYTSTNPLINPSQSHAPSIRAPSIHASSEHAPSKLPALYSKSSPISRFTNPTIDDVGLPLADALIAGIVAPVSEVFVCASRAYSPTWLVATLPPTTALNRAFRLFPSTLSHGAVLAILWTVGCLASRNYEKEAFGAGEGGRYEETLKRTLQAGSVATALLIMATQADLLVEFGRWVQPGESGEVDFRILTGFAEGLLDVGVEAAWLLFWRIYRTSITTRE
jgi:hypothetical protein